MVSNMIYSSSERVMLSRMTLHLKWWNCCIRGCKKCPLPRGYNLDYKETLMGGGFSFENPNPLWIDDISKAVADVISEKVNPVVASHGGHVDLIGIDDEGNALIAFGGVVKAVEWLM